MFGAFRASSVCQGGLLWKIGWRLSQTQKSRHRRRLQQVDKVIETLTKGLKLQFKEDQARLASTTGNSKETAQLLIPKRLQHYNDPKFFPKEKVLTPKDKYTVFDKKSRDYRKGIHKVPKWTKTPLPRDNTFH